MSSERTLDVIEEMPTPISSTFVTTSSSHETLFDNKKLRLREASRLKFDPACLAGNCECNKESRESLISSRKPAKYPKAVAFIISNEFCERFNYYGMRTILALYLTRKLHYDDDTSTVLFHVFTMTVYLCPLIGAIIADSWLGKFRTILYLSIVYVIGTAVMAIGAIPVLDLPVKGATLLGLMLIALGTGGIKPCVSAFGGDQFRLPEQSAQLAQFFSLFYFAINAGSVISTSITPILREDVHCFGDKNCYSLAFGVPAILMILSVVIFVAGKSLYVIKPPAGNMIFGVSKCISDAFSGWRQERKTNPRKHFLDYAESNSGLKMVSDTKTLLKILVLYLPFPVFWALFDQQSSRWTFQATRMNGEMWGYNIKPDQMQVINPLMILAFIPLFDYVLYPILSKFGIRRPLQKLTMGGMLAACAFVLSALVELKLESVQPELPGPMSAQVRIYNGNPCPYRFSTELPYANFERRPTVDALGMWEEKNLAATQEIYYKFKAMSSDSKCPAVMGQVRLMPGQATSYFIADGQLIEFVDAPERPKSDPVIRFLLNVPDDEGKIVVKDPADVITPLKSQDPTQLVSVFRGESWLSINGVDITNITTKNGGAYTLIVNGNHNDDYTHELHVITPPNSVHMMWQLPQIIVVTGAEIMFSVTGLEFSFTQAPQSMKSVLQACWLLSVAIGNMLVVIIAELKFFDSQAAEFALFAAIMIIDMFIFMLLAMRYQYVEHHDDPESGPSTESIESDSNDMNKNSKTKSNGLSNEGFVDEQ